MRGSRKKALLYTARWRRTRLAVLRRDNYRCHWCGGKATEADHLLSREEGGHPFALGNLVASCTTCNQSRGAEVLKARAQGAQLGQRRRYRDLAGRVAELGAIRL